MLEVWRDRILKPLPVYDDTLPLRHYLENSLLAFGQIMSRTGDDTLDGGTGADTFVYLYNTAGTDTINNFVLEEDKIDLSNLLIAFDETSDVNDYVSAIATEVPDTYQLSIDHDLDLFTAQVQIQLVVTGTTAEGVVDALNDAGSLELV